MDVPGTSPQSLTPAACLELLAAGGLGRIAYSQRALPAISTVAYGVFDGCIVLRLGDDSPALPALRDAVVAFQAEGADPRGSGWSVSCVGKAHPVVDPAETLLLDVATLSTSPREHTQFVRVDPELLEGHLLQDLPFTAEPISPAVAPAS